MKINPKVIHQIISIIEKIFFDLIIFKIALEKKKAKIVLN